MMSYKLKVDLNQEIIFFDFAIAKWHADKKQHFNQPRQSWCTINLEKTAFLLASLLATIVPAYTVCVLVSGYSFPFEHINILKWHGHEMLFGFPLLVISGFFFRHLSLSHSLFFCWILLWFSEKFFCLLLNCFYLQSALSLTLTMLTFYLLNKSTYFRIQDKLLLISIVTLKILHHGVITNHIELSSDAIYNLAWAMYFLGILLIAYRRQKQSRIFLFFITMAPLLKIVSLVSAQYDLYKASLHLLLLGAFSILAIELMLSAFQDNYQKKNHLKNFLLATISIGVVLRVFLPIALPAKFFSSLHSSMGFWTLGFLVYFLVFLPKLFKQSPS